MKIYLLYLIPKNKLYAVTDSAKYLERFLSERNEKLFRIITKKVNYDEGFQFLDENKFINLNIIPLEDSNGDCSIIGTIQEDNILCRVCDKFGETCEYLKLHFTKNVPFNDEYKSLLYALTSISKNINNHPIIQIDSVKLFYHLFKETFINQEYIDDTDNSINDRLEKYRD